MSGDPVGSRLTVRATTDPRWSDLPKANRSRDSDFSFGSVSMDFGKKSGNDISYSLAVTNSTSLSEGQSMALRSGETTTCSEPSAPMLAQGLGSSSVGSLASVCGSTSTMYHDFEESMEISKNSVIRYEEMADDVSLCNKLSPKVYAVSKSLVHSMEDLKPGDDYTTTFLHPYTIKSDKSRPWCSLQEIRKVEECNTHNCLVSKVFLNNFLQFKFWMLLTVLIYI